MRSRRRTHEHTNETREVAPRRQKTLYGISDTQKSSNGAINPPSVFRSLKHGSSQAVVTSGGRTLYVSGQTAWDSGKQLIGGADLEGQARQEFTHLQAVVLAAGATLADLVALRIYVVDYRHEKPRRWGASSWVGVAALADPGFLIEVEATGVFD